MISSPDNWQPEQKADVFTETLRNQDPGVVASKFRMLRLSKADRCVLRKVSQQVLCLNTARFGNAYNTTFEHVSLVADYVVCPSVCAGVRCQVHMS